MSSEVEAASVKARIEKERQERLRREEHVAEQVIEQLGRVPHLDSVHVHYLFHDSFRVNVYVTEPENKDRSMVRSQRIAMSFYVTTDWQNNKILSSVPPIVRHLPPVPQMA